MASPPLTETDFTNDKVGRYVYNTIPEIGTGPVDVLVVGGGSFGSILADHLFTLDRTSGEPRRRIVVLEAGPHALLEHIQNLPSVPLGVTDFPDPTSSPSTNVPWVSDPTLGFQGLAYCVGGRSLFWGGWSPELTSSELQEWPRELVQALKGGGFAEAKRQIGTDTTNDFIFGPLHLALRQRLFRGVRDGQVPNAYQVYAEEDLEAPLAVQSAFPRPGFFPINKFSTVPLLVRCARQSALEDGIDASRRRFVVAPNCRVTLLNPDPTNPGRIASAGIRWTEIIAAHDGQTPVLKKVSHDDEVPLSPRGVVIVGLGTIESTRLAMQCCLDPNKLMGRNLMAHLRSNLTIRIPRSNFQGLSPELAASALFLKGRSENGHFHFQITGCGVGDPEANSEAELFKKIPDIDRIDSFRTLDDQFIILTLRGIGEMEGNTTDSPHSFIELANGKAKVTLTTTARDDGLWDDMDAAAEEVARVFAAGGPLEYRWENLGAWRGDPPPHEPKRLGRGGVRDDLGTTHHEAGTLWMGDDPDGSVTDPWGRLHHMENVYIAGPALFPSIGSPNPMLTGTALARRTASRIVGEPTLPLSAGVINLLDPAVKGFWQMAGPGRFIDNGDGTLTSEGGMGLFWFTRWQFRNFRLTLDWKASRKADNSGVFVRFPRPDNNPWVAVDRGYEIQIDDLAQNDNPAENGKPIYATGAIYSFQEPTQIASKDPAGPDPWNAFVIEVAGQRYSVTLNGVLVVDGFSGERSREGYIGLQNHGAGSKVTFRNITAQALPD